MPTTADRADGHMLTVKICRHLLNSASDFLHLRCLPKR
jgi:hypothetical protein